MKQLKLIWAGTLASALLLIIFAIPLMATDSYKPVRADFLLNDGNDKAIVFFGFNRCADICPTTLAILRNLLHSQVSPSHWPQVAYVDIDMNSDQQTATLFARQFHDTFVGWHADEQSLPRLKDDFGLNIRQVDTQISHRGRTYLLTKEAEQWYIVKTYNPSTFDAQTLADDLY